METNRYPILLWIAGLLVLGLLTSCQQTTIDEPSAKDGVIDLRSWDFQHNGVINLDGKWEFYWQQLLEPQDFASDTPPAIDTHIDLPSTWNNKTVNETTLSGEGHATYRLTILNTPSDKLCALKLLNMSSSYKLWVNKQLLAANGLPGKNFAETKPHYQPQIATFSTNQDKIELVLQVANYHHRKGGAWNPLELGTEHQIRDKQRYRHFSDMAIFGALAIMGLYHFGLFALRRSDRSTLYFGVFCLLIAFRSLFYREMIILDFISIEWEWITRLRYLLSFASIPVFGLFLHNLYTHETSLKVIRLFAVAALLLAVSVFVLPLHIYSYSMIIQQMLTVLFGVYVCYILFQAIQNRRESAIWFMAGFIPFLLIIVNDILSDHGLIKSEFLMPFGLLIFMFSQAFALSLRSARAFRRVEQLTEVYGRFVPDQFIQHLEKDDIVNVKLGDNSQRNMTILFSDIRSFTTLSETMSPQDNFEFLNAYLERMEPIITEHHGFIDKYVGDEIMALFENNPDDAIDAANTMLRTLQTYNQHRAKSNYPPIQIGIGINTGELMLGIIGGRNRMDSTVISDAVNLASRMEQLTKTYRTPLLITEYTYQYLRYPERYSIRMIDHVTVMGKSEPVGIYEVFDTDSEVVREAKLASNHAFEQGMRLYREGNYQGAQVLLRQCAEATAEDHVAGIYLERIAGLSELT